MFDSPTAGRRGLTPKNFPTFARMESDQGKLNLKLDQKLDSVEEFKFEPIKGCRTNNSYLK